MADVLSRGHLPNAQQVAPTTPTVPNALMAKPPALEELAPSLSFSVHRRVAQTATAPVVMAVVVFAPPPAAKTPNVLSAAVETSTVLAERVGHLRELVPNPAKPKETV
jgi:hypothetical protein